ncbi:MAG: sigma 54-interacting transcriptional regulator [Pseudomonadota bacterium]
MEQNYKSTAHEKPAPGIWRSTAINLTIAGQTVAPFTFETQKKAITIGSGIDCDVVIKDDFVSREHCQIVRDGGKLVLTDLNSTNGTYLNNTRITKATLYGEETVTLGQTKIRIHTPSEKSDELIDSLEGMIGESESMQEFFQQLKRVAPTEANICLTGESGTGKDVAAKAIHNLSLRKDGPFVAVNCGALPETLIESQLFGYEKGAFTGAIERTPGLLEQSNNGTLFLDEIGEMPIELQSRLLRVLEEKKVRRLGGRDEIKTDFRLVTATHRDLKLLVKEEKFRFDLFWRLYVAPLTLPPLVKRPKDIGRLAEHFTKQFQNPNDPKSLSKTALSKLKQHTWPGNVRELKNVIQRAMIKSTSNTIEGDDIIIETMHEEIEHVPHEFEKDQIEKALIIYNGNKKLVAEKLGMARSTLFSKIKKYGIE